MTCHRIDVDGTVTARWTNALDAARAELTSTTVVSLSAPILPSSHVWVGVLDDFGAADQPLNRKAWALYGRSPIYGPMYVAADGGSELPAEVVAIISTPIEEWPIDDYPKSVVLGDEPPRPEMMMPRPS